MIRPADLTEQHLLLLRSEGERLARACATALSATEPNASVARVIACSAVARIADAAGIKVELPSDAPAAELVDVAAGDDSETIDMDVED